MNSQDFKAAILSKSPHFALSNNKIFEVLANKNQRSGEFSQFGPLYELFIYSFFIGIHIKSRIELPARKFTTDFAKIGAWKRESPIINFILFIVFSHSDEIGFDWNKLEHLNEKELDEVLKNIVTFIEEYAHGGLNYLKNRYDSDELNDSQYLFIDLLDEVIEKLQVFNNVSDENNVPETLNVSEDDSSVAYLINSGESANVEFKSTLRINLHTDKADSAMEHSCMKTIAAFLNTNGGKLIIGVDDKKQILGLDKDFKSFKDDKDQLDEFQKHLDNLIEKYFDNGIFSLLEIGFTTLADKLICVIRVKASKKGEVMLYNKLDNNKEEFYIRRSASTKALGASEMINYIKSHWN